MKKQIKKYRYPIVVLFVLLSAAYYVCLPKTLFNDPYATVLNAENGEMLSARIARDGQWRFPEVDSISDKYEAALLTFEDQYFYRHPGVNPLAMGRAMVQNLKAGYVVSGGSTLSMQVIRMCRKGKSRNIYEKLVEMILATRLELRYSKKSILKLYASHAPFGGNTVGIEAASWRYFGRRANDLSWAEAALLAVLPNQPSLLYPGRNTAPLKAKRDRLLDKMYDEGFFDETSLELAKDEPIPSKPNDIPIEALHLLDKGVKDGKEGQRLQTTLDAHLQRRVDRVVKNHNALLRLDGIENASTIVLDVRSNTVKAYIGNVYEEGTSSTGQQVDVIQAPRSTGSLLKPILYASLLDEGLMLPKSLLPDVPVYFKNFVPKNFTREYDGAVHADMALSRSLNIPAVHMLQDYGYPRFHEKLKDLGMTTLTQPASHYGLSMILGGSEGTLWDLTNIYAGMARTLTQFNGRAPEKHYEKSDFEFANYDGANSKVQPSLLSEKGVPKKQPTENIELSNNKQLSASSIWFTFKAMLEVYRPGDDAQWKLYSSAKKIAWKTGTSFGYRDGWAIGVTPEYVVGVWVGNADGEGRPGLTGIQAAAPILFDIFDVLPETTWFNPPMAEMAYAPVDRQSGYLASSYSIQVDTVLIPKAGLNTMASPFHQRVHLDKTRNYRVNSDCEPVVDMISTNWFVLPPKQALYYKKRNPTYQELPPLRSDCFGESLNMEVMDMVYPEPDAQVYIPINLEGEREQVVFEVAHRKPNSQLHWHLNDVYLGTTQGNHVLALTPPAGEHIITVVDEEGHRLSRNFTVLEKVGK
ncbi:penicillin-binding protein [Roseivirga seohaensis subsp. aquiponti]|uniref:peptidoglycan glycosyltransferase n=1 Tax=Roseivirga seohaensis subsp. aquiponti TaxID=1566026 RepID=A0A0L8AMR6_9BACT|nr:penicillin-binding protein 1C [Roseivirga seohaensis]KOF03475.1 penicillin-binding protein [Roseivirga seohaensis subsp. aquiponti]